MAVRGVSPSEKLLLLVLANYADEHMRSFPSHSRLASDTGLTERTILTLMKGLEARRMLSRKERRRPDGSRSSDIITLHFGGEIISPCGEAAAPGVGKSTTGGGEMVSPLTTFEPSLEEPSIEPRGSAQARPARPKPTKRCPEDWEPDELTIARLTNEGYTAGDLERALAMVRDHEFGRAHSDWGAVFRNWVRKEPTTSRKSHRPDLADRIAADIAEARRRVLQDGQ
jgi:hypothetical protein